jgi:hypothetical protein
VDTHTENRKRANERGRREMKTEIGTVGEGKEI